MPRPDDEKPILCGGAVVKSAAQKRTSKAVVCRPAAKLNVEAVSTYSDFLAHIEKIYTADRRKPLGL